MKTRPISPAGTARSWGTITSTTKHPPGRRWAAALANTASCSAWVVTFMIVLATRYTSVCSPGTRVLVMSPIVTATRSAPGLAASCSAMAGDSSIPRTAIPRALSGSATRPVPTANSTTGPSPASSASRPTMGSRTAGSACAA